MAIELLTEHLTRQDAADKIIKIQIKHDWFKDTDIGDMNVTIAAEMYEQGFNDGWASRNEYKYPH